MERIIRDDVSKAIDEFLARQLASKLEPELKKLEKEQPGSAEAAAIEDVITSLRKRYTRDIWLEQAATKMAKQLKFGTHISKGVHPDSRGDNINFRPAHELPTGIVGFQHIPDPELDANGNAAALPLAAFFNIDVNGCKLRDLIQLEHTALEGVFATDTEQSLQYQKAFQAAVVGLPESPNSHERNKQLLWPMDDALVSNNYHCLIPLHPSSLVHSVFQTINHCRYSEESKIARDNRKKKGAEQLPYVSVASLAVTNLGGTKPQNISLLTSKQSGRNFLLESLPPTYTRQQPFTLSKRQETFFNKNLAYFCNQGLQLLYAVIEAEKSVVTVRNQRKEALGMILGQVLQLAAYLQQSQPPGWSQSCQLRMTQKYWLDPQRETLEGQEEFEQKRNDTNWPATVMADFAAWLNQLLRKRFPEKKADFDDAEHREWLREMESAIKSSQRAGQGIFL